LKAFLTITLIGNASKEEGNVGIEQY
jgi:hypothetical protein